MDTFEIFIPLAVALIGLFMGVIYVLAIAVKRMTDRMVETNKQLMIFLAGRQDNPTAARALVAAARPPKKEIPGLAVKKKPAEVKPKGGMTVTVGSR